jgi:polyphenol oxidase
MSAPVATAFRRVGGLEMLTWPAFDSLGVDAGVTARAGGVSSGPYASLNLSLTVGDDQESVLENRRRVAAAFGAGLDDFVFARQVHGAGVRMVSGTDAGSGTISVADAVADTDALVTATPGLVLAILTADCVPIVLHDPVAGVLACVHSGWRGTVARIAAAAVGTMEKLGSRPGDIVAGVGPAMDPARYQVGPDVRAAVTEAFDPLADSLLRPDPEHDQRWFLDLWAANRLVLTEAGLREENVHVTDTATGPNTAAAPNTATGPNTAAAPNTAAGPEFFSDRAARPCGRLALVARLRESQEGNR